VPRTFANAATGYLVNWFGWKYFFLICFSVALPGMLLLLKVAPWNGQNRLLIWREDTALIDEPVAKE
jgi:MFS transporter, PAT family, beta-lactamase induction signal transducer AmpG